MRSFPVGCVGIWGDVFNNQGAYIGHLVGDKYGFDLDGNYLNPVDDNAKSNLRKTFGASDGKQFVD